MNAAARKWLSAMAPALVLVLLAIQVVLGFQGFDRQHTGLLGALGLPGRLLGWGAVALLLPLLFWLLVGWWGFGVTGMALKMLGAVTLGLAVGGLLALSGGDATGGQIGGSLARLLGDALGPFVAGVIFVLMAVPGLLLASARFQIHRHVVHAADPDEPSLAPSAQSLPSLQAPSRRSALASPPPDPTSPTSPSSPGSPRPSGKPSTGWYPQRRFDAEGNELPMDFGTAKDVGGIRYRDDRAPAQGSAASAPSAPPPPTPAPVNPQERGDTAPPEDEPESPPWPRGLRVADDDEPAANAPVPPPPVEHVRPSPMSAADRLRPQARPRPAERPAAPAHEQAPVRAQAPPPPPPPPPAPVAPPPPPAPPAPPPPPAKVFTRSLFPKNPGDPVRLPGVRYRDEVEAPAPPPPPPIPAPPPPPPPPRPVAASAPQLPPRESPAPVLPPEPPPAPPPARKTKRSDAKGTDPAESTGRGKRKAAAPPPPELALTDPEPEPAPPPPPSRAQAPAPGFASAPLSGAANDARYQSQLAASGIFDETPTRSPAGAAKPEVKPRAKEDDAPPPARPAKAHAEPAPEAPPARPAAKRPAGPPPAPPAPKAAPKPKPAWVEELSDEVFSRAVEASLERGAASAVLLTRRLGIGYGKAQALVERLARSGVLGEVTPNGARPVLIRREDLDAAKSPPAGG